MVVLLAALLMQSCAFVLSATLWSSKVPHMASHTNSLTSMPPHTSKCLQSEEDSYETSCDAAQLFFLPLHIST